MKILVNLDALERVVELLDIYQNAEVKLPTVYDAKHMLIATIKNGSIIKDEFNEQLANYNMFNPTEKHDDSQIPVRSKEKNIQAIKDALAKDPGKIMKSPIPVFDYNDFIELKKRLDYCEDAIGNDIEDKWARCHNAILEILSMLSAHKDYNNELSYTIGCKAEALKAKLVGKK